MCSMTCRISRLGQKSASLPPPLMKPKERCVSHDASLQLPEMSREKAEAGTERIVSHRTGQIRQLALLLTPSGPDFVYKVEVDVAKR